MEVKVYWNFHKKLFSVQHKGRVIGHAKRVIVEGVDFLVSEAGHDRVLRERCKNVHAFVCGVLKHADWITVKRPEAEAFGWPDDLAPEGVRVSYNPYKAGSFMAKANTITDFWFPIHTAPAAFLSCHGPAPVILAFKP